MTNSGVAGRAESFHTPGVKVYALAAPLGAMLALAVLEPAAVAIADDERDRDEPAAGEEMGKSTLWERIAAPNEREIRVILRHARGLYERASLDVGHPEDDRTRDRLLADARGMLRHGHKLAPGNMDVVALLARVDAAAGNTGEALAGYRTYMEKQPARQISAELCVEYGALQARLGQTEGGLATLERCIELPGSRRARDGGQQRSRALVLLSMLHPMLHRSDRAITVLHRHAGPTGDMLVHFALAVAYDKDEQITRAYDVLQRELDGMKDEMIFFGLTERVLAQVFAPAAERHYFMALLYETRGLLPEARAEWLAYVRSGDAARYRKRASKHIAAIDTLLQQRLSRRRGKRSSSRRKAP